MWICPNMILLKCNNVYITSIINLRDDHVNMALLNDLITYIQSTDTLKRCTMGAVSKRQFSFKQIKNLAQHKFNSDTDKKFIDKKRTEEVRRGWPFLRDRRTDAYHGLTARFLD